MAKKQHQTNQVEYAHEVASHLKELQMGVKGFIRVSKHATSDSFVRHLYADNLCYNCIFGGKNILSKNDIFKHILRFVHHK